MLIIKFIKIHKVFDKAENKNKISYIYKVTSTY